MALEKVGTFILTTESLDRHSERVLTKGINLKSFRKNSVMLYNHQRGNMLGGASLPIGVWKNIKRNEGNITADAFIDFDDDFAAAVGKKIKNGILSAVSIGFKALAFSDDPKDKSKGQLGYTITKSELLEASIVDIPANPQAVATSIQKFVSTEETKGIEANTPKEIQEIILYKSINGRTEIESEQKNISMEFLKNLAKNIWGKTFGEDATEAEVKEFLEAQDSVEELKAKMTEIEENGKGLQEQIDAAAEKADTVEKGIDEKGKGLAEKVSAKIKGLEESFEAKLKAQMDANQSAFDAKMTELDAKITDTAKEINKAKMTEKSGEVVKTLDAEVEDTIKKYKANNGEVALSKEAAANLWS